jgi:hypothetical protein
VKTLEAFAPVNVLVGMITVESTVVLYVSAAWLVAADATNTAAAQEARSLMLCFAWALPRVWIFSPAVAVVATRQSLNRRELVRAS